MIRAYLFALDPTDAQSEACPHKTAALENARLSRPVRLAELKAVRARLATVEAKLLTDPRGG